MQELYQNSIQLATLLHRTLPTRLRAFPKKSFASKKNIPLERAIHNNYKFLEYGKFAVAWLIVDLDRKPRPLGEMREYVKKCGTPDPTWICETERGFHIGWKLRTPIPTKDGRAKKARKKAKAILAELSGRLGGDPHAVRLSGIWRNPLAHPHDFVDVEYDLAELDTRDALETLDLSKPRKKGKPLAIQEYKEFARRLYKGDFRYKIPKGLRNATLWYFAMLYARKGTYAETERALRRVNSETTFEPLSEDELKAILRSVWRYKIEKKIFVSEKEGKSKGEYAAWSKTKKREYMREYRSKNRKRPPAKERVEKTIVELIADGIELEKIPVKALARKAKVDPKTARKYLRQRQEEAKKKEEEKERAKRHERFEKLLTERQKDEILLLDDDKALEKIRELGFDPMEVCPEWLDPPPV